MAHICLNGAYSTTDEWWVHDGQGVPLVKVCDQCFNDKVRRFRPEVFLPQPDKENDE